MQCFSTLPLPNFLNEIITTGAFMALFQYLNTTIMCPQVMKTYHMYHSESISAESKLKEAEKQEEKQIGRGDPVFNIRLEDKHQRRSSVKKIEKMKEKVEQLGVESDCKLKYRNAASVTYHEPRHTYFS